MLTEFRTKGGTTLRVLKVEATLDGSYWIPAWYGVFDTHGFCVSNRYATEAQASKRLEAEYALAIQQGNI